jgi:hypothetical protein
MLYALEKTLSVMIVFDNCDTILNSDAAEEFVQFLEVW